MNNRNPQLCKQGHKARTLACSLCFHIGRGRSEECPLQLERARERVRHYNSGTPQSLLNSNHFTHSTHLTHFTHSTHFKKAAFTLAEILVTLAVIGIVAVMTIPNLVQNYQSKSWDTASKVFDRKLTEALKVMNVQGTLAGYSSTESFVNELSKHLKITKTCTNSNLTACFNDKVYWGENKDEVDTSKLKTAKDFGQDDWNTNIVGFQLASGVTGLMAYNPECKQDEYSNQITGGDCLAVLYDVQGYTKPNTAGKDLRNTNVLALGSKKACDVEFGGSCWTIVGQPTPISKQDCEDLKSELGIKACYEDDDYWAGAVKQCGGIKNMPTLDQLAQLVTQIYGETIGKTDNKSGLKIKDQTLFDALNDAKPPTATATSFHVWSEEGSGGYAYDRAFGSTGSNYGGDSRHGSSNLAVCLSD